MTSLQVVCCRVRLRGILALFFVASALSAFAQEASKLQRDTVAIAVISKAVAAMGFTAATTPMSVRLTGSVSPTPESDDPAGTFVSIVDLSADGYQVRNEFQYAADGKRTIFVAGTNGAAFAFGQRVINMSAHLAMVVAPAQMPVFELIRAINNSNYQVSQAAPVQFGAVSAVHVKISDETDAVTHAVTLQDWYFDPASGLPLRWEFPVPDTFNATARSAMMGAKEFSNYQTINGMLLPLQSTYFRDGQARSITTINSADFNAQVPASAFALPTGVN